MKSLKCNDKGKHGNNQCLQQIMCVQFILILIVFTLSGYHCTNSCSQHLPMENMKYVFLADQKTLLHLHCTYHLVSSK
jgi:hypothetical protein